MSIALFAQSPIPIDEVALALRRGGLHVKAFRLDEGEPENSLPTTTQMAAFVAQGQEIIAAGAGIASIRKLLPPQTPLLLCAPQFHESDRQTLYACGATMIVTPSAWRPAQIAERIMAELISHNAITPTNCGQILGASLAMRDLYKKLETIARLDDPVLILGETGTGKELVAAEIHRLSGRTAPFLPINCPELTPELFASELFGHERGAFTGATQSRKGLIASVGKGAVFLDEIGDLDLSGQARLLRVIENRTVRPIGANQVEPVEARLIFATNRNLEEDCQKGKFRQDLFERLQGFTLDLPPLRQRREDLPLLFRRFVDEFCHQHGKTLHVSSEALDCLFRYDWPGNVRELRVVVRKAAAFTVDHGFVSPAILNDSTRSRGTLRPQHTVSFDPTLDALRDVVHRMEKDYLQAVLHETHGNKEAAAKIARLSRSQLYEKLKALGLSPS